MIIYLGVSQADIKTKHIFQILHILKIRYNIGFVLSKLERRDQILSKAKLLIIIKQVFRKNLLHIFVELLITIIKQLILI